MSINSSWPPANSRLGTRPSFVSTHTSLIRSSIVILCSFHLTTLDVQTHQTRHIPTLDNPHNPTLHCPHHHLHTTGVLRHVALFAITAITDVLKELHDDKRLYRIVSFTEKLDDHITTESAFLLSILLGRKDWVDELHVFRRGFPKYLMRAAFQDLVRREWNSPFSITSKPSLKKNTRLDEP